VTYEVKAYKIRCASFLGHAVYKRKQTLSVHHIQKLSVLTVEGNKSSRLYSQLSLPMSMRLQHWYKQVNFT